MFGVILIFKIKNDEITDVLITVGTNNLEKRETKCVNEKSNIIP